MSDSATMESEVAAAAGSPVKKVAPTSADAAPSNNGDSKPEQSPLKQSETLEKQKKAMQKMAAGKRDLLCQDANSAVASLAEACELLGQVYGETAKECGEAYFFYGKALLELARMEAGVIDNVLDGVPDTEDEEESSFVEGPKPTEEELDKIADDVGKALEENYTELEKSKKDKDAADGAASSTAKATNGDKAKDEATNGTNGTNGHSGANGTNGHSDEKKNGDESVKKSSEENSEEDEEDEQENGEEASKDEEADKEEEAGPSGENGEGEGEEEDDGKENESIGSNDEGTSTNKDNTDKSAIDKEEEEDPSNLQLAWEMLELAKGIFSKHADSLDAMSTVRLELESKLSETYQTLGEVSIENENYPQAIEDLTMCLRRRQDLLPQDSRCIAETHYQLGVALGFNAQFDEAVNALSDAIAVLEKRIALLKESKESQDQSKSKDAFYTREGEIKEIESIIPEIREKIADTKDMQEETIKKIGDRRLVEDMMTAVATAASTAQQKDEADTAKKAAGNISHLVKKRKKSDEEGEASNGHTNGSEVKKPHLENGAESASASTSNGH